MRKLLSVLCSACLCWFATFVLGVTTANAGKNNASKNNKVCICHVPPGNPSNAHTICIGAPAVRSHLKHGDSMGECPVTCAPVVACGGAAGDTCADDQFCKRGNGVCDPNAEGVCAEIPVTCPAQPFPVCGCDGTTYTNSCFADVAGVPVSHVGACVAGAACGGTGGGTCQSGEFCKPPQGDCALNAAGSCAVIPQVCPAIFDPVCGCDGMTYANACLADIAAVAVSHAGACSGDVQTCGGAGGLTCPTGEFCKRPQGECASEAEGVCEVKPAVCPAIFDPVCGCDGMTYANACVADAAGVTVANEGTCVAPLACGGAAMVACPAGMFCLRAPGECTEQADGVCAVAPLVCPTTLAEVCGCDGMTYLNACFALAASVTVDHTGACSMAR